MASGNQKLNDEINIVENALKENALQLANINHQIVAVEQQIQTACASQNNGNDELRMLQESRMLEYAKAQTNLTTVQVQLRAELANLRQQLDESDGETPPKRLCPSLASTPLVNYPGNMSASETTDNVPSRTHYVLRKDHAAFVCCQRFLEMVAEYLSRFYKFPGTRYKNPTFGDFLYAYNNNEAVFLTGMSSVQLPDAFTVTEWAFLDKLNTTVNKELHICLVPDKKNRVDIILPSVLEGGLRIFESHLRSIGKLVYGDAVVLKITGSHDISVSSESTGSSSPKSPPPH